jgi:hypothetical protein
MGAVIPKTLRDRFLALSFGSILGWNDVSGDRERLTRLFSTPRLPVKDEIHR